MPSDYLVRYGLAGYVGRFTTAAAVGRAARVVVRTPRGLEIGEVLCPADAGLSVEGELLRATSDDDDRRAAERADVAGRILLAAQSRGAAAEFLDAEPLLDGTAVVLHALPWADADLSPLLDELAAAFGVPVRLLDVSRSLGSPDPADKGCGKPDCGSGGGCSTGGCSTGGCGTSSCSSGTVKSADELTAYFADLRAKMEADARRTPLHG